MRLITVITDVSDFGFNLLRLSCALYKLDLIALVFGDEYSSNRIKDQLLLTYLEDIDNDEIILFTDGNDAVFMASEEEILQKYHAFGSNLVFSAETDCWPDKTLAENYPCLSPTPYKYLNSGGFIGKAGLIKELLNEEVPDTQKFKRSNQYIWAQRYFNNTDKISLDTNCEIFCTFTTHLSTQHPHESALYFSEMDTWFQENFVISQGRIFNTITSTWVCHAHFNGYAKWILHRNIADLLYSEISSGKTTQFYYASDLN